MGQYKFLVFSAGVEGRQDEYDAWYTNVHAPDVLKADGFKSVQRYRAVNAVDKFPTGNLAIYEIEADDPVAAVAQLRTLGLVISDVLDRAKGASAIFEAVGDPIVAES